MILVYAESWQKQLAESTTRVSPKYSRVPKYSYWKVEDVYQSRIEGLNRRDNINSPICVGTPQSHQRIASTLPKPRFSLIY